MQGHNIPDISMTLWESYHKKLQEVKTRVFFTGKINDITLMRKGFFKKRSTARTLIKLS